MANLITSAWSEPIQVTTNEKTWILSDPQDPGHKLRVSVTPDYGVTRRTRAGVFDVDARKAPIVVSAEAGTQMITATFRVLSRPEYEALTEMLVSTRVLLLRDLWNNSTYVSVSGDIKETALRAPAGPLERGPLRFAREVTVPVAEVEAP